MPAGLIADNPWAIEMITAWAPAVVLLVEALVPLLLWADVRAGIAFAGLFHWTIAITPPPNDIANFGASRRAHTRAVIVTPARRLTLRIFRPRAHRHADAAADAPPGS